LVLVLGLDLGLDVGFGGGDRITVPYSVSTSTENILIFDNILIASSNFILLRFFAYVFSEEARPASLRSMLIFSTFTKSRREFKAAHNGKSP
jgi:hypothetical protein